MADIKNLEGMIDSTPIMKDYADIESSKLPEYQIDSKIPAGISASQQAAMIKYATAQII